jgi:molybdenum cofactor cytidylyltransferase
MTKVSAILLAAGLSSRMEGPNKLLLDWRNSSLIEHTLGQLLASEVLEVVMVLGRDADLIQKLVQPHPKLKFVLNPNYESGMTSSIQAGVAQGTGDALMICLSDMPFLSHQDYDQLLAAYAKEHSAAKDILLPQFEGKNANPVIFATSYQTAILHHAEANGCSGIVKQNVERVIFHEAENNHFVLDIDTLSDYQNLKSAQ